MNAVPQLTSKPFRSLAFRFQFISMPSVLRPLPSGPVVSWSCRPSFLLSAFCFLLLNASAAEPKFVDVSALLSAATNVPPVNLPAASNAPPPSASAVPQITANPSAPGLKFADMSDLFQPVTNAPPITLLPAASNSAPAAALPPSQTTTNVSATAPTNSMDALDDQHKLAIGDRLSFRIVEDEEDPKSLIVTDSGDLEVPYIGRFPAVGKSCKELAYALKAELEKEYYYQATVIVAVDAMTRSRGKVYLVGPVRMPGPQEIPSDEVLTLSKAILRAGGFGDYADKHKVRVTRKGDAAGGQDQTFTVDVAEILEKGKTESDLPLKPGDLIYVPERLIRF